jgi:hypothetical protein
MALVGWFRRLFAPPYPYAHSAIVNTKDGQAFGGVLWDTRGDFLILRNARMLTGPKSPLDGDLLLPRANVSFLQVVSVTAPDRPA